MTAPGKGFFSGQSQGTTSSSPTSGQTKAQVQAEIDGRTENFALKGNPAKVPAEKLPAVASSGVDQVARDLVATESGNRIANDNALDAKIDQEIIDRQTADNNLTTKIDAAVINLLSLIHI